MIQPPPRLKVETSMHGFRCWLPRRKLGSNSSWILLFVPAWWVIGLGITFALDHLRNAYGAPIGDEELAVVGGIALLGWGLGWPMFDMWWAGRRPVPLVVEPTGLTLDDDEYLFSELTEVAVFPTAIRLTGDTGAYLTLGRLTADEVSWLQQAFADASEGRLQGGESAPDAITSLSREAHEQASKDG